MRRFFVPTIPDQQDTIVVTGSEARHIAAVVRLGINDSLVLFDRDGNQCEGTIIDRAPGTVTVRIRGRTKRPGNDAVEIVLAQAVTKGKKMDSIVQKSTELGVSTVIPFFCTRCIPRWGPDKARERVRHWQAVVTASVKQSGVRKVPEVRNLMRFSELMKHDFNGFLKLFFWEHEKDVGLKSIIASRSIPPQVVIVVGPEGGFTQEEGLSATQHGFIAAGLGNSILRTETVAIAVLSILRYETGCLG